MNEIVKTKISTLPKALREQVWIKFIGKKYNSKCYVKWCRNEINVFDFHVGHNIPASKGGSLSLDNLRPICSRCNLSMGNNYTIDEWNLLGKPVVANPDKISWWNLICGKK
jgi:5-methylcytosine-specific restriction endonuclease McrA